MATTTGLRGRLSDVTGATNASRFRIRDDRTASDYSWRYATTGSSFAARIAGIAGHTVRMPIAVRMPSTSPSEAPISVTEIIADVRGG